MDLTTENHEETTEEESCTGGRTKHRPEESLTKGRFANLVVEIKRVDELNDPVGLPINVNVRKPREGIMRRVV